MQLVRKPISNVEVTAFEFKVKGCEFLVKNLAVGAIYVGFGETQPSKEQMSMIPEDCWQRFILKNKEGKYDSTSKAYVVGATGTATGEGVEIECLKW